MSGSVSNPSLPNDRRNAHPASFADRLVEALSHAPVLAFAALSLLYLVTFFCMSYLKLLWLDELITLHIARLGSVVDIWHALAGGADPNPPVTHILVHLARKVFGEQEFALRLPAMLGYWVGMLSLFAYLRRHLPVVWALAGTVLSMTMAAFDYSYESRSYAIFYGLAMAAFYCWACAADANQHRKGFVLALFGMACALMIGISTNYFAVLAFLPIAAGEVTRSLLRFREQSRQSDGRTSVLRLYSVVSAPIGVTLIVSLLPLLVYRSMIAHSIAQFAPHAWNKVSLDQAADSYTEMVEVVLYPLLALFAFYGVVQYLAGLCRNFKERKLSSWLVRLVVRKSQSSPASLPTHESVGVFFLMAYPLLGYLVASIHGGMLSPRFVIPVCFGFAIAGIVVAYQLLGHLRHAGFAVLCLCLAWFIARESVVGYRYSEQKQCFYKVLDRIPVADTYLPGHGAIAVPDPLMALTLQHYAPAAIASRVVFPIDFPAIRKFRNDDSPEQNIWAGRNSLYTLRVLPLAVLQQETGNYLVLASDWNWLLQDLDRHRYAEHRLPINTRAGAIGGFTPLSHGLPAFYVASGVLSPVGPLAPENLPIRFSVGSNLPGAPDME